MSATDVAQQTGSDKTAIRSFQVNFPEADLAELRRRINATRWPEQETVTDDSQGVRLATMQELAGGLPAASTRLSVKTARYSAQVRQAWYATRGRSARSCASHRPFQDHEAVGGNDEAKASASGPYGGTPVPDVGATVCCRVAVEALSPPGVT